MTLRISMNQFILLRIACRTPHSKGSHVGTVVHQESNTSAITLEMMTSKNNHASGNFDKHARVLKVTIEGGYPEYTVTYN